MKRIEKRAPTVALLVRQWCSAVFRYAVATLRADNDPTAALKGALSRPKVEHSKPLTKAQIPSLLEKLQARGGNRSTQIAMNLLLLTFVRPVELRAGEWKGFDLDHADWRIPGERMKMRELASYNQAAYLAERREMLQQWADMIDGWRRAKRSLPVPSGRRHTEMSSPPQRPVHE